MWQFCCSKRTISLISASWVLCFTSRYKPRIRIVNNRSASAWKREKKGRHVPIARRRLMRVGPRGSLKKERKEELTFSDYEKKPSQRSEILTLLRFCFCTHRSPKTFPLGSFDTDEARADCPWSFCGKKLFHQCVDSLWSQQRFEKRVSGSRRNK